jgi:hypothetical protein
MASIFYKSLNFFFRLLFGLSLISLGINSFNDKTKNINTAETTLQKISPRLEKNLKNYLPDLIKVHRSLLILIGIGLIFNISSVKVLAVMYFITQVTLLDNFILYKDQKFFRNFMIQLSIMGSVLMMN